MSLMDVKFGAYTVVRQLSVGETSEVFLAKREGFAGFARQVVIKCVPEHLNKDSKFIEQFRDEAQLVARLNHPNIVPVHEFGQEGKTHYLMMEYIPGISVDEAITKTFGIEPAHALRIASEMCSGLAYAHTLKDETGTALGIVHRNINPQNVLLGFDGSVKLIDFGIAQTSSLSHETRTALFKGKYGYLSPEQASGGSVDHRTDIHAVGVVLWEMLMGVPLFDRGNAVDTVEAVLHQQPSPVLRRHPELSGTIDEILAKALAKSPGDRYQSCSKLQEELDEYVATTGMLSTSTSLGRFVRTMCDLESDGSIGDDTEREVAPKAFGTGKTSLERPSLNNGSSATTERYGKNANDAETNELLGPTSRRAADPMFPSPPSGPPPTVRVAPLRHLAGGDDLEDPERLDPTIPMPEQYFLGSGVGAHIARLAAAQTPDEMPVPPQTPSYPPPPQEGRDEPESGRRFALWVFFSIIGIVVVAAATLFVLRRDLVDSWTSRLFAEPVASATRGSDASTRDPQPDSAKVLPAHITTLPTDAGSSTIKVEAGVDPRDLPSAFLTIRSEPSGAQLFLDGNPTREWTGIRDLPIDPGEHTIELVLVGYRRWKQVVNVERGQRHVLRATLRLRPEDEREPAADAGALPDFGILNVDTRPPSLVYLGRKSLGQTPVADVELPSGDHQMTFVFENGRRQRRSVRILSGRTTRRRFDFTADAAPRRPPGKQDDLPTKQDGGPAKGESQPSKTDGPPATPGDEPSKATPVKTKVPQKTPEKQPTTVDERATKTPEVAP